MLAPVVLAMTLAHVSFAAATVRQPPLTAAAQSPAEQPWPPAGVERAGTPGVKSPKVLKSTKPEYTADAMRARIQGLVVVEAVVKADGTVGDVRVTRSLDREYGLDDEAIKAVKAWQFVPARKDGEPVPFLARIELTFTVRK